MEKEKCEHNVEKKFCFRCKRPDLAGTPPTPVEKNKLKDYIPGSDEKIDEMIANGTITTIPSQQPVEDWENELEELVYDYAYNAHAEYGDYDEAKSDLVKITSFISSLLQAREEKVLRDLYESKIIAMSHSPIDERARGIYENGIKRLIKDYAKRNGISLSEE